MCATSAGTESRKPGQGEFSLALLERVIVRRTPGNASKNTIPGLHPLLQRIFLCRGIVQKEELDYSLADLPSPSLLKGVATAVDRLRVAFERKESILILGDYDTDGATAAVLAILGLRGMGASQVDYLVPNRFEYGYGLSPELAHLAMTKAPSLVITVDNGISSVEGVQILEDAGIDVIITDHHLPGTALPAATAIINPNQNGCDFPSDKIAGVGVMFYLLMALRIEMRKHGDFSQGGKTLPNLAQFLDLVALGTVADVVPLDHVNRILVAQGIARIRRGHCRPGIRALLHAAGKDPAQTSSTDLGFVVAPRLNAAGRLDDISLGIECLLTEEESRADQLARKLHQFNTDRRQIEQKMQQEALDFTTQVPVPHDATGGICLFGEDWHQGVTGLVASRVKERYFEPVIAFAPGKAGMLTGSARSVSGLNIRDLLADLAAETPGLVEKFGGHAMAAGLSIRETHLETFRTKFRAAVQQHFETTPKSNIIQTDGPLEPEYMTLQVATMLRNAAPWGQHFPVPVFDNEFAVVSHKRVGEQHLKLSLRSRDRLVEAIAFRVLEPGQLPILPDRVRAVFQLEANHFRGEIQLQLIIEYLEPIPSGRAVAEGSLESR